MPPWFTFSSLAFVFKYTLESYRDSLFISIAQMDPTLDLLPNLSRSQWLLAFSILVSIYVSTVTGRDQQKYPAVDPHLQFASYAVYNLYFSPLAKIPGPFFAKISSWPSFYHAVKGDRHIWIWQGFQKYGELLS